jgi:peptidoglycan/xylan/chitin deacetylase (PgdA/CDA1 family)
MQLAIRRFVMENRRSKVGSVWPIDPEAGKVPAGWPGWPEGKKFALVLTHDVEGQRGCQKCSKVAAVDERFGFRSSFNFVAEGYTIPPQLRSELMRRGFEVGLHGVTHDGHLYRSREYFQKQAVRINRYLSEWKIVGFRSPAMHRNFEWLGDLDIEYDASSFDTDPFEPYPDGVGTIFPFHIELFEPRKRYVELPYTLPQDSTIFITFQERSIDIWRRKLDWIIEKGGMALLNTHPDYMCFDDDRPAIDEYSSRLYEEFLRYINDRYAGQYWNALPKEVAGFWNSINKK